MSSTSSSLSALDVVEINKGFLLGQSSRTDLYDDVVDVTSSSAPDVVETDIFLVALVVVGARRSHKVFVGARRGNLCLVRAMPTAM